MSWIRKYRQGQASKMDRRSFLRAAAAGGLGALFALKAGPLLAQYDDDAAYYSPLPPPQITDPKLFIHPKLASGIRDAVGVRLVCLFDISGSIDSAEYEAQLNAMADAIASQDFRDAVYFTGGPQSVAICVADFGDNSDLRMPWVDFRKGDDWKFSLFSDEVRALKRRESGMTGQAKALQYSMVCLQNCPWKAKRSIVDMITDGQENVTMNGEEALKLSREALGTTYGATVNALITLDSYGADDFVKWSWANLVTQHGFYKSDGSILDPGFVKVVATQQSVKSPGAIVEYYKAMELAFRRKLILEVAGIEHDELQRRVLAERKMNGGRLVGQSPSIQPPGIILPASPHGSPAIIP